jgi:hypothetical protein
MAIKFTAKDEPVAAKAGNRPAKAAAAVEDKPAAAPAEDAELFPAAPKAPTKKRKSRFS